jgi:hypothetical protein
MKFAAIKTKVKSKLKRNSATLGDGDIKLTENETQKKQQQRRINRALIFIGFSFAMGFLASPKACKAVEFVNGTTLVGLLPGNASDVLTESVTEVTTKSAISLLKSPYAIAGASGGLILLGGYYYYTKKKPPIPGPIK